MPSVSKPRRDVVIRVPRAISAADHDGGTNDSDHPTSSRILDVSESMGGPQPSFNVGNDDVKGHQDEGLDTLEGQRQSQSYEYASHSTSAAEWNSLLIWARRQRGPQWDSATGMWQVDQGSTEYYSFASDPARHTKLSRASNRPIGADIHGNGSLAGLDSQPLSIRGNQPGEAAAATINLTGDTSSLPRGHRNDDSSPPLGPGMRRSRMR